MRVATRIGNAQEVEPVLGTRVEGRVSELDRLFRSPEATHAVPDLSAVYLTINRDVAVSFDHERRAPEANIAHRRTFPLSPIVTEVGSFPVAVDPIHWNSAPERSVFLSGGQHGNGGGELAQVIGPVILAGARASTQRASLLKKSFGCGALSNFAYHQ